MSGIVKQRLCHGAYLLWTRGETSRTLLRNRAGPDVNFGKAQSDWETLYERFTSALRTQTVLNGAARS